MCKKTTIVRHYSHLVTTRSPILAFPIDFQFFGWSLQFFSLYQDLLLLAWLLFEELRVVVKVLTTDYWFVAVLLFLFLSKLFTCKAFSPLTFPLFNKMSESFLPRKIFSILAPGYCSLTRIQSQNRQTISTWFVLCGIIHNKYSLKSIESESVLFLVDLTICSVWIQAMFLRKWEFSSQSHSYHRLWCWSFSSWAKQEDYLRQASQLSSPLQSPSFVFMLRFILKLVFVSSTPPIIFWRFYLL